MRLPLPGVPQLWGSAHALFALLDAALSAPVIATPAHLSLAPSCQGHWGRVDDAHNQGTMDIAALANLIA